MDFEESAHDSAFRSEARQFLQRHAPPRHASEAGEHTMFVIGEDEEREMVRRGRAWQRIKYEHGWAGIDWPKEYGGRGGTATQDAIFRDEERRFVSPWLTHNLGFGMAASTLLRFGTESQKKRALPEMLSGDAVWCQLFSEPNAGSDLGGVRTSAVRDGDVWVVNGQKVWSSRANLSDWGLLVARSDFDETKYRGITVFVLDMRTPGIEIRPIEQLNRSTHFNEVFFTDVQIPSENVVGEVHNGWGVALGTLGGERSIIGSLHAGPQFHELVALAHRANVADDAVVRQRLAEAYTRIQVLAYLGYRVQTSALKGIAPGPESSITKLFIAEHVNRTGELALDLLGAAGTLADADGADNGRWSFEFLTNLAYRIGGGTDEMQRNTIGERVLGLPSEPRVDKGVPFRLIPT
jgi:alkylation response protein AidB-like acyl-CoA dehydrogenase